MILKFCWLSILRTGERLVWPDRRCKCGWASWELSTFWTKLRTTHWAYHVKSKLNKPWFNIMTLNQGWFNVDSTSCACIRKNKHSCTVLYYKENVSLDTGIENKMKKKGARKQTTRIPKSDIALKTVPALEFERNTITALRLIGTFIIKLRN